jgi:hypothetical protein
LHSIPAHRSSRGHVPGLRNVVGLALAILAGAAGVLGDARVARAHPDGSYPRTFNLDWTNNPDALRDSKYDVVSLSARATAARWDSIKALNPASIRLAGPAFYIYYYAGPSGYPEQTQGPYSATDPVFGYDRRYWDLMNDNDWWCWAVDSLGTRYHATAFWQMWLGNFSSKCPRNAQGQRLCDVYGDFVVDNLVAPHNAEGVFFDQLWDSPGWLNGQMGGCEPGTNCSVETPGTKFRTWFDLDADGVPDPDDSLKVWWSQGVAIVLQHIRDRMGPNFVIAGNGHHHYTMANGAMDERFPRLFGNLDPAPNPYGYRWQDNMFGVDGYLSSWSSVFATPRYNFIDTELGGGDYYNYPSGSVNQQLFRFNLGSTLLGDGYMGLNNGYYGCWYWQPEYDLQLGFPTGPATSVALSGLTVWTRSFTNGEVWVNPNGYALPAGASNPAVGAWDASIAEHANPNPSQPGPPPVLAFERARPNPFPTSGQTTLSFTIDAGAAARLDVLDLRGRLVRHVWSGIGTGDLQAAAWDGRTEQGYVAPVGVYFARLEGPGGLATQQKLVRSP